MGTSLPKDFNFNRAQGDQREHLGVLIWTQQFPRIDELERKINGTYMLVEPRSSLDLDDFYLGRWRAGGLHRSAAAAAFDALVSVKATLTADEPTIPMTALYPVLRAAIENTALAMYLLAPPLRDERLRRAFQLAADEAHNECRLMSTLGRDTGKIRKARAIAELRILMSRRPTLEDPRSFTGATINHTEIVRLAHDVVATDPATPPGARMPLLALWQLLSGLSHGRQWAMLEILDRSQAVVNPVDETAAVKLTSPTILIAYALFRAVEVLECTLRIYGQRSKAAWSQIEDAAEPRR